jgi:hypothetical protein
MKTENMHKLDKEEAIKWISSEWDTYRYCQRKAEKMGKRAITLRKLFYRNTGIMLPILCWWETKEEMIDQYRS